MDYSSRVGRVILIRGGNGGQNQYWLKDYALSASNNVPILFGFGYSGCHRPGSSLEYSDAYLCARNFQAAPVPRRFRIDEEFGNAPTQLYPGTA